MPEVKILQVVEVSSEDPQFPASNLLTGGEWWCPSTEEKAWVLLQLEEPSYITDIGFRCLNEVASVEVKVWDGKIVNIWSLLGDSIQVGNRESNTEEMEILLGPTNDESRIKVIEV